MGVRPPTNDNDPDVIEFGIAALDATLSDENVEYPTDTNSLSNELGDVEIPLDAAGHTMTLEAALDETDDRTFDSKRELLNALHPVLEARREATGNNWLGQLRSLVPF